MLSYRNVAAPILAFVGCAFVIAVICLAHELIAPNQLNAQEQMPQATIEERIAQISLSGSNDARIPLAVSTEQDDTCVDPRQYFQDIVGVLKAGDADQVELLVREGSRRAIEDLRQKWKDPNPIRGYCWDASSEMANLRDRLNFMATSDASRKRIVVTMIKEYLENHRLSNQFRDVLYGHLISLSPGAEMGYFGEKSRTFADPWLSSRALGYLARNGDFEARRQVVENLGKAQTSQGKLDALANVSSFLGEDAETEIPSQYWYVLYRDDVSRFPEDYAEEIAKLRQDVLKWWPRYLQERRR